MNRNAIHVNEEGKTNRKLKYSAKISKDFSLHVTCICFHLEAMFILLQLCFLAAVNITAYVEVMSFHHMFLTRKYLMYNSW